MSSSGQGDDGRGDDTTGRGFRASVRNRYRKLRNKVSVSSMRDMLHRSSSGSSSGAGAPTAQGNTEQDLPPVPPLPLGLTPTQQPTITASVAQTAPTTSRTIVGGRIVAPTELNAQVQMVAPATESANEEVSSAPPQSVMTFQRSSGATQSPVSFHHSSPSNVSQKSDVPSSHTFGQTGSLPAVMSGNLSPTGAAATASSPTDSVPHGVSGEGGSNTAGSARLSALGPSKPSGTAPPRE